MDSAYISTVVHNKGSGEIDYLAEYLVSQNKIGVPLLSKKERIDPK